MLNYINNYYFLYFFICISIIFLYGRYRCLNLNSHKDPLEISFIKKFSIDGWSFTHLFFFMIIGFVYPFSLYLSMFLGIIWELFETYVGYYKPNFLKGWGYCSTKKTKKIWWYGKWSDIIVNFIGFKTGQYIKLNKIY